MTVQKLLVALDEINVEIQKSAFDAKGTVNVDKKWLNLFDATIMELIETRRILDFASHEEGSIWGHILGILKAVSSKG